LAEIQRSMVEQLGRTAWVLKPAVKYIATPHTAGVGRGDKSRMRGAFPRERLISANVIIVMANPTLPNKNRMGDRGPAGSAPPNLRGLRSPRVRGSVDRRPVSDACKLGEPLPAAPGATKN